MSSFEDGSSNYACSCMWLNHLFFIERFKLSTYGENLPESLRLKIIEDADAKA